MPTPAERSALLFVAAVAALGLGVRGCRTLGPGADAPPSDRAALAQQLAAVDSAIAVGGRARRTVGAGSATGSATGSSTGSSTGSRAGSRTGSRVGLRAGRDGSRAAGGEPPSPRTPLAPAPSAPIDVDRAGLEELDQLPGIGPALAARIVADRDSLGAFGSLDGFLRVRGIGPAMATRLAPLVAFSGTPRAASASPRKPRGAHP